jgi:hypothetical protein
MYVFPPDPVRVTDPPSQNVVGPLAEIPATGTGKIVTGILAEVEEQPKELSIVTV